MLPRLLLLALLAICFEYSALAQAVEQGLQRPSASPEICNNGIDDDGDGFVDCYDPDCNCFNGEDCSVPELMTDFRARLAWQSGQNGPSITAIPVVANMNPQQDSMPEIIVAAAAPNGATTPNKILFYRGDGSNRNNPMVLTVPNGFDNYPVPGPTIGDINRDGKPELVMSCNDARIRVFRNYTENPTTPMTLWITSTGQLDYEDQKPYLADFDGDGTPEIYAGSDVFKFDLSNPLLPRLDKVINGPGFIGQAMYNLYQEGTCSPTAADVLSVADCNGDPDCDGLELIAGPVIYSIDIDPNDGDGYQIRVKRDLNQMAPGNSFDDGYTAVADIDLDGVLDIVVSGRIKNNQFGVYAWNKNGFLGFFPYPNGNNRSGSLACIANLYDDKKDGFATDYPEIVVCNAYNLNCFNLHAAQLNAAKPYWWSLVTKDYSGFTGSSVYDFNGDGIFELVYRDEDNFRILYGGAAPFPKGVDAERNWFKIPCGSLTSDEYPVVADVDNDGETEIAVTGYTHSGYNNPSSDYRGRLDVFESDAEPWVPCRNVWNQYNYFVVNVNDDLTIPKQQQEHHLEMPAPGSGNRPLNRYLSQRQLLDEHFQPFLPVPDALAQVQDVRCAQDLLDVKVEVCNQGSHKLPAGTPVAFYSTDPTKTNAQLLGAPQLTTADIDVDSCAVFLFKIPLATGDLFGVVNDNGSHARPYQLATDFPVTDLVECFWPNNIFQFAYQPAQQPFNLGPDLAACGDTIARLSAGAGHLAYHWQDGSTDSVMMAQTPGWYWVEVSDYCLAKRVDSVRLERYGFPGLQLDTINGDCQGHPASVRVSAQGNYGPMSIQWNTGATDSLLTGLDDGMYAVTVTDARGCRSADSTWVEAGGLLQAEPAVEPILCFGQQGLVAANILEGRAPWQFAWSNSGDTASQQLVQAGTYTVTVTDANGCSQVLEITLPQPAPLASNGITPTAACPGEANGAVQFLGALDGTPPYALMWSIGSDQPALNGLVSGNYNLHITDANGCALDETVLVPSFSPPELDTTVTMVTCFGADNGRIAVQLAGGSPGFGFVWSNGAKTPVLDQLAPGPYALSLTYADGKCAQVFDFYLTQPPEIQLATLGQNPNCAAGTDGSIDLNTSGGLPPYSFAWSGGSTSEDPIGLPAGNYTVTVTDAAACSKTQSLVLSEPAPLSSNGTTVQPACPGQASGSVGFLGASQGSPPYTLLWSTGDTLSALSAIPAGPYTLTVTDAHQCSLTVSAVIPVFETPQIDSLVAPVTCFGAANGSIWVTASGGTPPIGYTWSNSATAATLQNLAPGDYQLTVTYAGGKCAKALAFRINEPPLLELDLNTQDPLCAGGSDGRIDLSASGGTPPYGLLWSTSGTTQGQAGLAAGTYTVTLTDAQGCTEIRSALLSEPPPLLLLDSVVIPIKCFGGTDGAITLTTGGGVAPYAYAWSNGQTTASVSGLAAGLQALTITDALGCPLSIEFVVTQPEKMDVQTQVQADTCHNMTGDAAASTVGGIPPYTYLWSNGTAVPALHAVPAGQYDLTLQDANGCTQTLAVQVPALGEYPVAEPFTGLITCAQPFVEIGVSVDQGSLHYTWMGPGGVLPDQGKQVVGTPGHYVVTVTNAYGCAAMAQLDVGEDRQIPVAEAGAAAITVPCNTPLITLNAAGSSSGPGFSNQWLHREAGILLPDTMSLLFPVEQPGEYVFEVRNLNNGCSARDSIQVDWAAPVVAALVVDSISCFGLNNGRIQINTLSGGAPPLLYSIDNVNFTTKSIFTHLPPGDYPVQVRDALGCSWAAEVQLSEPDSLAVDLVISDSVIELGRPVRLEAFVSPPDAVLQDIVWQPKGLFDFVPFLLRQTVQPGADAEFSILVVDQHGCPASDRVSVRVDNNHIYVPNVIYPGSDNNGWFTIFTGDGVTEIRLLRIYDRWGEHLFEKRHFPPNVLTEGWDGEYRAEPINPGVFAWYAELVLRDGRVLFLKGDVTVVR